MSDLNNLHYAPRLTAADVDPITDLIGVYHPSGGFNTSRAISLADLSAALGGGGAGAGEGASGLPGVVQCPNAGPPNSYTLANCGMQFMNADGEEIFRIWGTDPHYVWFNSNNLYVGLEAGRDQPIESSGTAGYGNTGIGSWTLRGQQTGSQNVAVGVYAMGNCGTDPDCVTAVGGNACFRVEQNYNTGFGNSALFAVRQGQHNIGVGCMALGYLDGGGENIGIGDYCGYGGAAVREVQPGPPVFDDQAVLPDDAISMDSQLVLLGNWAGRSLVAGPSATPIVNAIALGYRALFDKSNTAVIGNAAITDVYCGSTAALANVHAKGITFSALPTAVDGLAPGTLWNNAGVVNVAP